ncbi:MAG: hypothetical protein PHP54_00850 [Clostridia bacterium]|nr:hypothetical protein [Clostridia bacterium]
MRYYIYLDREFLRTLFSVLGNTDFNIEVVEFSIRKSFTKNNAFLIDPCIESINQCEEFCKEDEDKNRNGKKKDTIGKERLGARYDQGNSCNIQTEKRYLNIEDITNMKNINFYHTLLESIQNMSRADDSRIVEETGYIKLNRNETSRLESSNKTDEFFMINDTFVWIDNTKLNGDLSLLCDMSCKIKVIGYRMNCQDAVGNPIIKAIAIFIE